jgi:hypothetical protein
MSLAVITVSELNPSAYDGRMIEHGALGILHCLSERIAT